MSSAPVFTQPAIPAPDILSSRLQTSHITDGVSQTWRLGLSTRTMETLITPSLTLYAILTSAIAAGTNLSTTIISLPALLQSPSDANLEQQFSTLYHGGVVPMVTLTLTSTVSYAVLAYRATLSPSLTASGAVSYTKRNLFVGAAVCMLSLGPFTRVVMGGVIDELVARARAERGSGVKGKGKGKGKERETKEGTGLKGMSSRELVERWGVLNFWRGCLLLLGAGLGGLGGIS